jgi:hypothetical protein
VSLSARGSRNLYDKVEKIEDPTVLAQVQKQAAVVRTKSMVTAIILTLLALALPVL